MKEQKKPIFILIGLIVIALAGVGGFYKIKQHKKTKIYSQAEQYFQQKDYSAAKDLFNQLGSYKDSAEWIKKCDSQPELDSAASLMEQSEYEQAREIYKKYNLQDNYNECTYQLAISYADSKEYEKSLKEFEQISSYKDSSSKFQDLAYRYARSLFKEKKYSDAKTYFEITGDYKKAKEYLDKCNLANKYSSLDINGSYFGGFEPDNSKLIELYEYMESWFEADFYGSWYDASGESIEIGKFSISGIPYYITKAITNSHPEFDFQYENTTGFHHFTFESSSSLIQENVKTIIFDDTVRYYNIGGAELQEFLKEEKEFEKEEERQRQKQANKNSCWNDAIQRFGEYIASNYALSGGFLKSEDIDFLCKNKKINLSGSICTIEFTATNINTWSFTGSLPKLSNMNVIAAYNVSENGITCTAFSVTPAGHSSYW